MQYRVLVYYAAAGLQKLGISFKASYLILRGAGLLAVACLFHYLLLIFFPPGAAFTGVLILFAALPQTYLHYFMQEMDIPNLIVFLLGLIAIVRRRDWMLIPLIALGMINRETPVFLPIIWLFVRWDELPLRALAGFLTAYYLTAFGVYGGLQAYFGRHASFSPLIMLSDNLSNIHSYIGFAALFGFLLYPALKGWGVKPKLFRRASLVIPWYIGFNLVLTIFVESRLLALLYLILIPLAIASFVEPAPDPAAPPERNPFITRHRRAAYALLSLSFAAAIAAASLYGAHRFEAPYRRAQQTRAIITQGTALYNQQRYAEALDAFQSGVLIEPDNFDLHYNLGILYYAHFKQPLRARLHFLRCLAIDPTHASADDIRRVLEEL